MLLLQIPDSTNTLIGDIINNEYTIGLIVTIVGGLILLIITECFKSIKKKKNDSKMSPVEEMKWRKDFESLNRLKESMEGFEFCAIIFDQHGRKSDVTKVTPHSLYKIDSSFDEYTVAIASGYPYEYTKLLTGTTDHLKQILNHFLFGSNSRANQTIHNLTNYNFGQNRTVYIMTTKEYFNGGQFNYFALRM